MLNAVVCPACAQVTKKRTELNELTCDKCGEKVCFYCVKKADEDHYMKNSCLRTSKLNVSTSVDDTIRNLTA